MPVTQGFRTLADVSPDRMEELLNGPCIPVEETEREHPQLAWMRRRAREARAQLQLEGILDANGKLVRPEDLPEDMLPTSETEC